MATWAYPGTATIAVKATASASATMKQLWRARMGLGTTQLHIINTQRSVSSRVRVSKLGRKPIMIPPEVSLVLMHPKPTGQSRRKAASALESASPSPSVAAEAQILLKIQGPLGELELKLPEYLAIRRTKPDGPIALSVSDSNIRQQREMWGTTHSYIRNHLIGVSEGHSAVLRLVGVGYRASIEESASTVKRQFEGQKFVNLKVGFSHPVELAIPRGITASCPQPTRILLEGINKETVKQFAAHIRQWRVPEPYKGKGIFVNDEKVQSKAKKIK